MSYYSDFVIGTLFLFEFYICGMDVLPDMSGYIFIYIAFKKIAAKYKEFNIVKKLLIPLIWLSSIFLFDGYFDDRLSNNLIYIGL